MKVEEFYLDNGIVIDVEVIFTYEGHDGIGSYEYHGSKEYDEGSPVYSMTEVKILSAHDPDGNEIDLSKVDKADILEWEREVLESDIEYDGEDHYNPND